MGGAWVHFSEPWYQTDDAILLDDPHREARQIKLTPAIERRAAGPAPAGGWMFFVLSDHFSKLANIQMPFNRPLESYFCDPESAKVY